jgi:Putative adhesin
MSGRCVFRARQIHTVALFCFYLVPLCAASDWRYEETHSDVREFVAGGSVHVRLSIGDVHIKRGAESKIRLEYTVKSRRESNLKQAHVDFDVRGNEATLAFHGPSGSNSEIDVELEVPANTNVDVHAKVGDITVERIAGDKDLDLGVGDIHVAERQPEYKLVRLSTSMGDVDSDSYGESSGWLGKTLKYNGEGKYELRAHVGVGDIRLEGK